MTLIKKIFQAFSALFVQKRRRVARPSLKKGTKKAIKRVKVKKENIRSKEKKSSPKFNKDDRKKEEKRPAKQAASPVLGKEPVKPLKLIKAGEITHYFSKIQVVVVKVLVRELKIGDQIQIKSKNTSFLQKIKSLQIECDNVKSAKRGQLVGLKIEKEARVGDKVFLVVTC